MLVKKVGFIAIIMIFLLFLGQVRNIKAQASILDQNDTSPQTGDTNATPSAKPIVNTITNKDQYITGTAEINSIIYVKIGNDLYNQRLENTTDFKIYLKNHLPLKEGTIVTVYVTDNNGLSSSLVTLKVIDIISPKAPSVNKVTDKSFAIRGMSEPGSTVYIKRNANLFGTVNSDSAGKFSLPIPLQIKGTVFEVYAMDPAKNKSANSKMIVTPQSRLAKKVLNIAVVKQLPELPRGCEVTSLTMLLNYTGIKVNKMTLAQQVKKDPSSFRIIHGKKYFGNPNYGFVGNMYTFSKPGFGVFNQPIEMLAKQYRPNRIVNLSGQPFGSVLNYVSAGHPVWIINTSWFSYVPNIYWQTWYTSQGPVRITMKEHSVLVTGYDSKYVYFNDPLEGVKNKKKPLEPFIDGWEQFKNQAISYY